ncbi:MAG: aldo/keto reductase [Actinomycetota bacterium]
MTSVPSAVLDGHIPIPQLGLGTWRIPPAETAHVVADALEAGYRHIDTAQMYENEQGVGEAVNASGIRRDDLWVTSKLNNSFHEPSAARSSFDDTLRALNLDYIDLFLIHWPLPMLDQYVDTWRTLIELHHEGRVRCIGVSNFQVAHLERLAAETDMVPAVNQIEVHPYFGNEEVRAYGREHGIVTEAWSPIARGKVLDDPAIASIADDLDRTPAQVVLRWHLQRGDVIFPKSVSPQRIRENIAITDFTLDDTQMAAITALDRGEAGRGGPNPDTFDYIP